MCGLKVPSRKNIITVDIKKENYQVYKMLAEMNRFETKSLINQVLDKTLQRELKIKAKYPNLSISEVVDNRITLIEENKLERKRELVDLFYDKDLVLNCHNDKSRTCKHVIFAKNSEISVILATKRDDKDNPFLKKYREQLSGLILNSRNLVIPVMLFTMKISYMLAVADFSGVLDSVDIIDSY
jgi:hypothetical protein